MGARTGIEWADSTFNAWRGCEKISPACTYCYAADLVTIRQGLDVWGKGKPRIVAAESSWKKPMAWNRAAERAGRQRYVFANSLSDTFEDHPMLPPWRQRLCELAEATPWLVWFFLTKRPENIAGMVPASWCQRWPSNVWPMTTVESQEYIDRAFHLIDLPGSPPVLGLSIEPMLSAVNLVDVERGAYRYNLLAGTRRGKITRDIVPLGAQIDWVIIGGEAIQFNRTNSRPMHPEWARHVRQQCAKHGTSFFMKQWGDYAPDNVLPPMRLGEKRGFKTVRLDGGGDRIFRGDGRFTGEAPQDGDVMMYCVGKEKAGAELDGEIIQQRPTPAAPAHGMFR